MNSRDLAPGDHLSVKRIGYSHHGIYIGDNKVIHFTGASRRPEDAFIRIDTLAAFARWGEIEVEHYEKCFAVVEVIRRAHVSVGQDGYHLFVRNCEHFARWCKTGQHESQQIRNMAANALSVAGNAGAGAATLSLVSAAGAVGMSGAGMMSGLAAFTGTVTGGVASFAAAPAVLTAAAMHRKFNDDPHLSERERAARKLAREGSKAAVPVGVGASLALVSAVGVTGLSGAGITSGLAGIGSVVGGGMAAGLFITVALPGVFVWGVGQFLYRASKRKR